MANVPPITHNSDAKPILMTPRGVSSPPPWAQVVRGDSEPINSPSPSDCSTPSKLVAGANSSFRSHDVEAQPDNAAKKSAWNKPSNDVGAMEPSPVMEGVSWPALSESTRVSPKSSSSDSLKALSDGSFSLSQGSGIASTVSHNQVNNTGPNSTPNHVGPMRQRSMKHGSGSSKSNNVLANGGFPQQPQLQGSMVEIPANNLGKSSSDHTPKESGQKGGSESYSHSGCDHQQQQQHNYFRRMNGGPRPRGDGSHHHHGFGGRRGQDSRNQDWNPQRSFIGRDNHLQPQRGFPRGFVQPTLHNNTPFIPTPPMAVGPFGNHMMYPDMTSHVVYVGPPPEPFRGLPIVTPMPPMFFPIPDPQLQIKILNQIEYYFSNDNLIKDTFLRQNMDDQGWVPIKLIAGFKKVMHLTEDIQLIMDALRTSTVVEIQGEKLRKRNDWMRWLMSPAVQFSTVPSRRSIQTSNHDALAAHLGSVTLYENSANLSPDEIYLGSRSSSGELSSQSQQSSNEGTTSQVTVRAGFDRATSR